MVAPILSPLIHQNTEIIICPACSGPFRIADDTDALVCLDCQRIFNTHQGIPLLYWPNEWQSGADVTEEVRSFYEQTPFPNYEDFDSSWSLREKAREGLFASLLDEQIPHGSMVLEIGCGTAQLSNFLGMRWGRTVFGSDLCLNSLELGQGFKEQNKIDNVALFQMNLFRPAFKRDSFDLLICNGVLHHTSDPLLGLQTISTLVKPGGHIIVGLYNTYGRLPTDIRRLIFRLSGNRFKFIDHRMRSKSLSNTRKQTWFMDQYKHPHESKHNFGEVLRWFDRSGIEFVNSIPKLSPFDSFSPGEQLFSMTSRGSSVSRFGIQAGMLLKGGGEGGFFLMIGRKPFS